MTDRLNNQLDGLRESLEAIQGHHAETMTTVRRRLTQAVELIDHGRPDLARQLLTAEAEALAASWLAGDAGGRA